MTDKQSKRTMGTIDSRTIRAGGLRTGHYLVGVDAHGEHVRRVQYVERRGFSGPRGDRAEQPTVVVVLVDGMVRLGQRDMVRIADPSAVADSQLL